MPPPSEPRIFKIISIIANVLSLLLSILVMSFIASRGWINLTFIVTISVCVYNNDTSACDYGTGISVIGLIASIAFLVGEYYYDKISAKRSYLLAVVAISASCSLLFFAGFCYLTNSWRNAWQGPTPGVHDTQFFEATGVNNAVNITIASCFLSILSWGTSTVCALIRFCRSR